MNERDNAARAKAIDSLLNIEFKNAYFHYVPEKPILRNVLNQVKIDLVLCVCMHVCVHTYYMTCSNCVRWLTRSQFEERWMQLLGVVNQPPPQMYGILCVCVCNDIMLLKGMPIEEVYAVGIGGVVSLLLATL